ncbi:hypothetical protein [Streptomyces sp. NPDC087317]|uniref:hypothetical protein n=1 Tax=Streptomyces sp. NPDC087317 TaxID=3365784 RepID=UPI0037FC9DC7
MRAPGSRPSSADRSMERYAHLVAQGTIKLKPFTVADRHHMPHHVVPENLDPRALLPAEREGDDRL